MYPVTLAESATQPSASGNGPGIHEDLARRGLQASIVLQGDPSFNLTGGLARGAAMRVPAQATLDVDLERLVGFIP